MKIKGGLLASAALGAMGLCFAAPAHALSDHPSLCISYQREWDSLSQGTLAKMQEFIKDPSLRRMCPKTENDVAIRIASEQAKEQEQARQRQAISDLTRDQAATKASINAATKQLAAFEETMAAERNAKLQAEAVAQEERRKRLELEAAASIPGRSRNLIACSLSQDVERLDQGNIPGMKFTDIIMPPEIQVVFDIADIADGVVDVYGFDIKARQWSRTRAGAQMKGKVLTVGGTSQNENNLRLQSRQEINLDAMNAKGRALADPVATGGSSLLNFDGSTGNAGINLGALLQSPPRMWIEQKGNCAYQNGEPPGPLTATPEFRITSRAIPNIPKS